MVKGKSLPDANEKIKQPKRNVKRLSLLIRPLLIPNLMKAGKTSTTRLLVVSATYSQSKAKSSMTENALTIRKRARRKGLREAQKSLNLASKSEL
jgi:hypothetical protein